MLVHEVKIGSARRMASSAREAADIRVKEQFREASTTGDSYEILHIEDFSDICETGDESQSLSNIRTIENGFHKKLKSMGMWVPGRGSEWFVDPARESIDNVLSISKKLINEKRYGVSALSSFSPFAYQQQIVNWAVDRLELKDDLLINAIMRAGKCFISYEIARARKAKTILIVTGKVGVTDSWAELLPDGEKSHVNYYNWKFHGYKKTTTLNFDNSEVNVVMVSLQYINKHFDNPSKLLKQIFAQHWDIVFYDEQHYATLTDNTKRFWNTLQFSKKIELSGTPYKTLLSGRYDKDDIYNFGYVEEQMLRKQATVQEAEAFKYRADINYAMVNVPDKVKSYLGEDGFTFPKLFATENGDFKNVMAVNEFFNFVVTTYKKPPNRFAPIADKVCRHALWVLPNDVSAINAVEKMLTEHPFFSKRTIINASGVGVKDIQQVKDQIQRSNFDHGAGTITLTCGRFLEGTSVPEWWSVHQMNNDKSAADYFQGSFRCKTPWSDGQKESVIVFDYAPERFVNIMYQHCEQQSITDNRPVDKILAEWLNVSEVYDYVGNTWNLIDGETVATRFLSDINNYMDRVGNAVDITGITDDIILLLSDKKADPKNKNATSQLNTNDILTGTNKKRLGKKTSNATTKEVPDSEEAELRIKYALRQVFKLIDVAWADSLTINSFDDIINYKDISVINDITGLVPKEWEKIKPAINLIAINRAIGQYNDFQ
jgi:superfamily II DNA or RNA helicase